MVTLEDQQDAPDLKEETVSPVRQDNVEQLALLVLKASLVRRDLREETE